MSSLKDKFYSTMNMAKRNLKEYAQKYYVNKSRKVRNYTIGGLILTLFVLVPTFLFSGEYLQL
ncbi:hypothetical protein V8V91_22960 [Algoriphagus halophilus]|uniref:hypothetical protein n=1 Tax=Algoriphagus halophilus TaxID=226505 RepID=UPI00358FC6EC